MAMGPKSKLLWILLVFVSFLVIVPGSAKAQLVAYLDSVTATNSTDSIVVNIYVDNYSGEKITGYTLFIRLKYADFIGFFSDSIQLIDTTYENCVDDSCVLWNQDSTVCLEYTCLSYADTLIDTSWVQRGALDTTSTLSSGWDFVDVSILDSENRSVKINAIANQGSNPGAGIPSPTAQGLLCKVLAGVKPYAASDSCQVEDGDSIIQLPWSECFCDSLISVEFDTALTRFSNDSGQFIGWVWSDTAWTCITTPPPDNQKICVRKCAREVTDTGIINHCLDSTCFYEYNGSCYLWECTDCNLWDSSGYVDPQQVLFSHGQIEVTCPEYMCGDANADGTVNVSDAVYLINYVFIGGAAPNPMASGDANCDGTANVSDAVYIINYVFIGGTPPCDLDANGQPDC
jgi:hypothetical protein